MTKKTLDACKDGNDFYRYALKHGGWADGGDGSHIKVRGPAGPGFAVIPLGHNHDLAPGTRHSIMKDLARILVILLMASLDVILVYAMYLM